MSIKPIAERISQRLSWTDLDLDDLRQLVRFAKDEDLEGWGLARKPAHGGDVTSQSIQSGSSIAHATLAAREELVVAGLPLVQEILSTYGDGATFTPAVSDGTLCRPGQTLGQFTGPARLILEAERVMLNFLQRLSGVASTTRTHGVHVNPFAGHPQNHARIPRPGKVCGCLRGRVQPPHRLV
jgi:nicotinate-nucleotide pyrophosphorylase (carboxylating)